MQISDRKAVYEVIKRTSGQNNILTIPRIYIDITGDVKAALFLSQCIYWADIAQEKGRDYFYHSYKEWEDEICLSRWDLDIARKACSGLVTATLKKANGAPTLHYKVEWDKLYESIKSICEKTTNGFARDSQMDLSDTSKSLTETTTENTTDINTYENYKQKVENEKQETLQSIKRGEERHHGEEEDRINQYPEDVRIIITAVCELFNLRCPPIRSTHSSQWVNESRELKDACGEFERQVLIEIAKDFEQHMRLKGGTVPFPVSGPRSLVNTARAKAGEMRTRKARPDNLIPKGATVMYIGGKVYAPGVGEIHD